MDKIFSARVDETVIRRIDSLSRRLHRSKKRIIEDAVRTYADMIDSEQEFDLFEQTCGAWKRDAPAGRIAEEARKSFRASMERHRK